MSKEIVIELLKSKAVIAVAVFIISLAVKQFTIVDEEAITTVVQGIFSILIALIVRDVTTSQNVIKEQAVVIKQQAATIKGMLKQLCASIVLSVVKLLPNDSLYASPALRNTIFLLNIGTGLYG